MAMFFSASEAVGPGRSHLSLGLGERTHRATRLGCVDGGAHHLCSLAKRWIFWGNPHGDVACSLEALNK